MSAYLIADMESMNEERFHEYGRRAAEVTRQYGGRVLVVGGSPEVLEGAWTPHFLIIIEFPTRRDLKRWYECDAYRELVPLRRNASKYSDFVSVEGIDPAAGPPPGAPAGGMRSPTNDEARPGPSEATAPSGRGPPINGPGAPRDA